ncbi:PEP/pyruvate-binding domain-containing protein [Pseudonocardia sp. MH-G8]|uniref:PEP/pyruvate-binding domain-containing protein n=1 Tax=Pseudonocardia sp. MH-G8 TaxID=1854588 RepID=UPI000BA0CD50|nr:PEP/pyruvate-binding domain-containing protein [Pseudonocardia sp. MH-G8]OZM81844.1 phosphoenolpyruvate synthase [Pseudonocardia sp. MH-G8]
MTHATTRPDPTDRGGPTTRFVLPLTELGRDDLASAGGKGANLGELVRAGFPVPDGVVISTDAYAAVVAHAGLEPAAAGEDGAALREAFAAVGIPGALRESILEAYAGLGSGPVAVRSSATAEDLPGAAFAGQQDTYLNVVGADALLDAVRRCWGSLWTERAIAYRARRDIAQDGVRIAVVVQQMVVSEYAGVLFTANPVTGARDEVVVDASSGLGEAVVSGLVTPDHYVLDAAGSVRERKPGRREVVVRGTAEGGVAHRSGEEHVELPDAVLAELAALGRAVAVHFGRPQDIEWAYAGGRVSLVQARPMTALPPPPIRLSRIQRFTGPQFVEMMPVRPYPMDVSGWITPGIGRMVKRMMAEIAGLRFDFADVLPERDGVVDRFVPPQPHPTAKVLSAPARNLPRIRRFRAAGWTRDPRFTRFDRAIRELSALEVRELSWPELRGLPHRAHEATDLVTDLRVDYLPRVGIDLLRLRVLKVLLRRTDLTGLTLGTRSRTEDANRALAQLAAQVREDGRLRTAFALEPQALAERVDEDPAFARFRAALAAFLEEYGHRETASALLMSAPTWGEAPATVLGMVKVLVEDARPASEDERAARAEQRLLAHPLVRLTGSGPRVRRLLVDVRAGIALREDTHFHGTRALPVLRRAVLEMGRRLTATGVLSASDDVLHLRLEELESLDDAATVVPAEAERLRAAVRSRSARRAELAGVPLIAPAVLFGHRPDVGDALVTGTPASGGQATGPVRVIREAAEFGLLRSGDVLVCAYTNPAWTPLFQRAAAVVVDTGGLGSHAAIVAREYGIPAVMGSATGTATLVDGQVVTVDGDTGRVRTGAAASGTLVP